MTEKAAAFDVGRVGHADVVAPAGDRTELFEDGAVAQPLDRALIEQRLKVARALRERLSAEPYYRLVCGESDQLPGLVLDRYGAVLVGQIATAGMEALKADVEAAVQEVLRPAGLFWKNACVKHHSNTSFIICGRPSTGAVCSQIL